MDPAVEGRTYRQSLTLDREQKRPIAATYQHHPRQPYHTHVCHIQTQNNHPTYPPTSHLNFKKKDKLTTADNIIQSSFPRYRVSRIRVYIRMATTAIANAQIADDHAITVGALVSWRDYTSISLGTHRQQQSRRHLTTGYDFHGTGHNRKKTLLT